MKTRLTVKDWNEELNTEHGIEIVRTLDPISQGPVGFKPPVDNLEDRISLLLKEISKDIPIKIISVSRHRQQIRDFSKRKKRWAKDVKAWREGKRLGKIPPEPVPEYEYLSFCYFGLNSTVGIEFPGYKFPEIKDRSLVDKIHATLKKDVEV